VLRDWLGLSWFTQEGILPLGRILVVDDEEDKWKSVRLTLTKAGYEVVDAEDGEKAIQQICCREQTCERACLQGSI
jgi:PleD family two-component response regulator